MKKHFVLTELKDKIIIKFELQDNDKTIKIYDKRTKEVKRICNLLEVNKLNFEYSKGIITVSKEDIKEIYFDILIRLNLENHIKLSVEVEKILLPEKFQENKGVESMESLAKVYVTNLGKYNEGYLVGKWFDLPCEDFETEFNEVLKSIKIDGIRYEEYFITDWETEINGLEIGEYTNIEELNKQLLEVQSKLEDDKQYIEKLATIIDCFGYDIENAMENMENHTFLHLEKDSFKDEINLANAYLLEVTPISQLPRQVLENNFNYESYGRDIQLNNYNNFFEDEKEIEEMDKMTEKEVADWFLELIGSIEDLAREELERYFDIESYGRELMQSYSIDRETYIAVSDY